MQKSTFICDDVLEFSDLFPDAQYSLVQLTKGRFGFTETNIQLPKVSFFVAEHSSGFIANELIEADYVALIFPIAAGADIQWRNDILEKRSMLVLQKGQESVFAVRQGSVSIHVHIDIDFLQSLGWTLPMASHVKVPDLERRAVVDWCFVKLAQPIDALSGADRLRLAGQQQRELVLLLKQLLSASGLLGPDQPTVRTGLGGEFETVQATANLLRSLPLEARLTNSELANSLGVSERQLYRAFQDWVGIGPAKYQELVRLHRLRAYLKSGAEPYAKLSEIAQRFGYSNPGRMAGIYADFFAERPSETLRRARQT
ncbi:AraC family transcriptional regulator [Roseibium alexandrii]|uniref:AraC family transcriptional regulator n=1 Tax=Roseibium alexandrii TaxID=388408 RepID=UPI00375294BC